VSADFCSSGLIGASVSSTFCSSSMTGGNVSSGDATSGDSVVGSDEELAESGASSPIFSSSSPTNLFSPSAFGSEAHIDIFSAFGSS